VSGAEAAKEARFGHHWSSTRRLIGGGIGKSRIARTVAERIDERAEISGDTPPTLCNPIVATGRRRPCPPGTFSGSRHGVGFIVTSLPRPAERVIASYNQRGAVEQWIKEGKGAIKWTPLFVPDLRLHLLCAARIPSGTSCALWRCPRRRSRGR